MYTSNSIEKILNAGGCVIVGEGFISSSLEKFAKIAKSKGGHVTIRAKNLTSFSMESIAKVGGNNVTFDISSST